LTVLVAISVLDRSFAIQCEAEEWAAFLKVLWEPALGSVKEAEDDVIHISRSASDWRLRYGDYVHLSEDPWVIAAAIRNFVSIQALRRSQAAISLHAATVRFHERVLLLAGPSEAGKTTLLLDLVEAGWEAAGDDLAVVSPRGREIRTYAKPVHVRDRARWARFRDGWDPPSWVPHPSGSGLLPPRSVRMVAGTHKPTAILFPRFDPTTEPALHRLSPAEAVASCAANCQNPGGANPPALAAFATLCQAIPAASFTYPSTRDSVLGARRFLQESGN
jgi:hypothetical protein